MAHTDRQLLDQRLQAFIDQGPLTVYVNRPDRASSNVYMSPQLEAILGYSAEEWAADPDFFRKVLRLLAVDGAPIPLADHADRSLAAAREMLELRLPRFNRWLGEHRLGDGFAMGIGLNSGHFMSGNVGSTRQLEYTVHGDTVNTAARVETMTESTERSLLVAESTCQSLLDPPSDLAYVGEFEVRGRESRIRLWTLSSTNGH